MLERLGNVLYWLGIAIATPLVALGLYGAVWGDKPVLALLIGVVPGLAVFAVGRALLYILAGR